eukprot:5276234-Pleurochrysis_carterae.AAC.1
MPPSSLRTRSPAMRSAISTRSAGGDSSLALVAETGSLPKHAANACCAEASGSRRRHAHASSRSKHGSAASHSQYSERPLGIQVASFPASRQLSLSPSKTSPTVPEPVRQSPLGYTVTSMPPSLQ